MHAFGRVIFADALSRLAQVYARQGETAKSKAMYAKLQRDFPTSEAAARPHGAQTPGTRTVRP